MALKPSHKMLIESCWAKAIIGYIQTFVPP